MIPQIDAKIGITVYTTNFAGTGGRIKVEPEDFKVFEIISDSALKSITEKSGYAAYMLEKRNIDTAHAISTILKRTGARLKPLGLKDATAITRQYVCSISKTRYPENITTGKFSLERIGFSKKPLTKKNMIGNRFKIKITEPKSNLSDFKEYNKILNFYGYQRFGSRRPITHLVGSAILHRDFEKAIDVILSHASKYDTKENFEIRQKLSDRTNYQKCLDLLPPQMDIEKIVLKEMIAHGDPLRAIRAIPISLRRFYVHAFQSYIFNRTLCDAFSNGEELFGYQDGDIGFDPSGTIGKCVNGLNQILAVPLVGYSYYKKTRFHHYITKILELEEMHPSDFFIKEMQEVSSAGGFRQSTICCTEYKVNNDTTSFILSRGSFATILLREVMKPDDPIKAGF